MEYGVDYQSLSVNFPTPPSYGVRTSIIPDRYCPAALAYVHYTGDLLKRNHVFPPLAVNYSGFRGNRFLRSNCV